MYKHCKPIPCNENRVFPVNFFSQGNPCNENRVPAMRTGFPCNENRFFPVRKSTQGKLCSGPVLALYGLAVHSLIFGQSKRTNFFFHKIGRLLIWCSMPDTKWMQQKV